MRLSARHYGILAKLFGRSTLRYLLVGGVLFLLDFTITRFLYIQLHQPLELAQWVGRLTGASVGYWAHRLFTFQKTDHPVQATHIRFWLVATLLWTVSPYLLKVAITIAPASFLMAKVLTEGILVCASYTLLRFFVFRPIRQPTTSTPLVSVVIASYNHAPFIKQCLQSVLAQDMHNLEIIVTDDGSQDSTAAQVADMAAQQATKPASPQIHLHTFTENQGACAAMNDAIRRARGQYIAVLNSDDQFLPGKLQRQINYLAQHPHIGAVFGWPTFIDEQGAPFADAAHKDHAVFHQPNRTRQQWLRHFFDHGNALCHPTALLRREVYDTVGLYDPRLAQVPDLDQWIRVCQHYEIHVLPEPLTAFRIRDQRQNASAARPEVVIRDAWERARILRHYLTLAPADLAQAFPEFAAQPGSSAEKLAHYALAQPYPFYHRFALDAWFDALPAGGKPSAPQPQPDPTAWRRFITATATHDLHRLYP